MLGLFAELPVSFVIGVAALFGLIIGSFLNVYIYRFHTGKSLSGNSHCLSCGTPLRPYELVPMFSYLALRGRCRTCASHIPSRYFLVELLTGLLFVGVVLTESSLWLLGIMLALVALLVVVAVYDLYHMVIPDEFVLAATALALARWLYLLTTGVPTTEFFFSMAAAVGAGLFFFLLWYVSRGTWIGFGDVKLVVPLALALGYGATFSLVVLSFWIGAGVGLVIMATQKLRLRGQPHLRLLDRELTMKSAIPFAPFLILGFLTVYLFGVDVVALLTYV